MFFFMFINKAHRAYSSSRAYHPKVVMKNGLHNVKGRKEPQNTSDATSITPQPPTSTTVQTYKYSYPHHIFLSY